MDFLYGLFFGSYFLMHFFYDLLNMFDLNKLELDYKMFIVVNSTLFGSYLLATILMLPFIEFYFVVTILLFSVPLHLYLTIIQNNYLKSKKVSL